MVESSDVYVSPGSGDPGSAPSASHDAHQSRRDYRPVGIDARHAARGTGCADIPSRRALAAGSRTRGSNPRSLIGRHFGAWQQDRRRIRGLWRATRFRKMRVCVAGRQREERPPPLTMRWWLPAVVALLLGCGAGSVRCQNSPSGTGRHRSQRGWRHDIKRLKHRPHAAKSTPPMSTSLKPSTAESPTSATAVSPAALSDCGLPATSSCTTATFTISGPSGLLKSIEGDTVFRWVAVTATPAPVPVLTPVPATEPAPAPKPMPMPMPMPMPAPAPAPAPVVPVRPVPKPAPLQVPLNRSARSLAQTAGARYELQPADRDGASCAILAAGSLSCPPVLPAGVAKQTFSVDGGVWKVYSTGNTPQLVCSTAGGVALLQASDGACANKFTLTATGNDGKGASMHWQRRCTAGSSCVHS